MVEISPHTRVLIVGLGKSGLSAINFCQWLGAEVFLSEAGPVDESTANWLARHGVVYEAGGHSRNFFDTADLILISPGVPHYLPMLQEARQQGIPVIGEMALAPNYLKTSVMAITGTNGKTTVTTLLGELLQAAGKKVFVGGNIGAPLTDYLTGPQEADWVVLEVSSFQLDASGSFRPDIGILLNISPDHLDRYATFADYGMTKMQLFAKQRVGDIAIINHDDPEILRLMQLSSGLKADMLYFGHQLTGGCRGAQVDGSKVRYMGEGEENWQCDLSGTPMGQAPNPENAAAAILAAQAAGCPRASSKAVLADFRSLPHRMTLVAEIDGVRYIDDSKATNIGAVCAALDSIAGPVVLIAGGRDKGGDYELLAALVREKVKTLLLIGEARYKMAAALEVSTRVELLLSLEQAVDRARAISAPGDTVLLSPACSSFDMFSGYVQRGEEFQRLVKRRVGEGHA